MKKPSLVQKCKACKGTGEVPLSPNLHALLSFVKAHPGTTIDKIWESQSDEITPGAIANRMTELLELELVARSKKGRVFHYSLAK